MQFRVLRYDLATGGFDDLSSKTPLDPTLPLSWNRHGWLVGVDRATAGRAALWTPAGLLPLPDLGNRDPFANVPVSVTDDGRTVVGTLTDRDGESRAAIWHCHCAGDLAVACRRVSRNSPGRAGA